MTVPVVPVRPLGIQKEVDDVDAWQGIDSRNLSLARMEGWVVSRVREPPAILPNPKNLARAQEMRPHSLAGFLSENTSFPVENRLLSQSAILHVTPGEMPFPYVAFKHDHSLLELVSPQQIVGEFSDKPVIRPLAENIYRPE